MVRFQNTLRKLKVTFINSRMKKKFRLWIFDSEKHPCIHATCISDQPESTACWGVGGGEMYVVYVIGLSRSAAHILAPDTTGNLLR